MLFLRLLGVEIKVEFGEIGSWIGGSGMRMLVVFGCEAVFHYTVVHRRGIG